MRVSKLLAFLIVAMLIETIIPLGPITAGENPWGENPYSSKGDSTGMSRSNNGVTDPTGPTPNTAVKTTLSSALWQAMWNLPATSTIGAAVMPIVAPKP